MATKAQMTQQEKEWRAQDDAHVLAAAQEIKSDPSRLKNAQTAANKMVAEQEKRTNALKSIAGKTTQTKQSSGNKQAKPTTPKPATPKTTSNTKTPGKKK